MPLDLGTVTETCRPVSTVRCCADGAIGRTRGRKLSTTIESDGYPRTVDHGGAQTGSRTYFKIDRRTRDGYCIHRSTGMPEWT